MRTILALTSALAVTAASTFARADQVAMAQALFDQGKSAMAAHDYAQACSKFKESYRLQEGLGTLLNLADCYEHEGKLASAWGAFLEVAAAARRSGQTQRAEIARTRAARLAHNFSNMIIDVPPQDRVDGMEVREDGTVVGEAAWGSPIPSDAGPHEIQVLAPGKKSWSQTVVVDSTGGTARVTVPRLESISAETPPPAAWSPSPPPAAASPPSPPPVSQPPQPPVLSSAPLTQSPGEGPGAQRIAGWVVGGVGIVGAGAGGLLGLLAKSQFDHAETEPALQRQTDSAHAVTLGNIATIVTIAGAATAVAGVIVWLTAPHSTVQVGIGGQEAFLGGHF